MSGDPLNLSDWDAPGDDSQPAIVPDKAMIDLRQGRRKRSTHEAWAVDEVDRLPPQSIEAEQGVLGCIFLAAHECLAECIQKFKMGHVVFYDLRHQTIYELLVEMYDRKEAIDVITAMQRLKDKQALENVGGIAYLATLPDLVPSAANLSFYLNIVLEKYLVRQLITRCSDIVGRAYEHEGTVDELLDEAERDVLAVRQEVGMGEDTPIKEIVHGRIEQLEKIHANGGALMGLSTGFPDLDVMTTGLHGKEMIVVAARPSMGKTSLAMNIAEAVALDQKLPVGVFSQEMSKESLVMRMLMSRARVNLRNLNAGFFSERDFPKITNAAGQIANSNIHIRDVGGLSILQLRAKGRRMWQEHGIKLFVIDYLQLLHSTSRKAQTNRQVEVSEISNGIKEMANELNVPVIVLAQLNRELEKSKSKKPNMGHLRESGAIEADADLIGLLYKPEMGDEDDGREYDSVAVNLDIAKQRNGPTGTVHLTFLKTYTRFESAAKISSDDVPQENHVLL